ncbi:MAG: MarR family transcriptional regulator [Proteobacteria bacterium]|nr:MarR family transcriptional regulator [Pseudomonadota bacterium]
MPPPNQATGSRIPPPEDEDEARREVLFVLHDLARLIRVEADKRAREHGMTRAQWVILVRLERQPGMTQKELAEAMEVEPITVARLIDRMEARGLVERRPDARDRRVWRLHLRAAAQPVLVAMHPARTGLARAVTDGLDAIAIARLSETLMIMKAALTGEPRARAPDVPSDAGPGLGQGPDDPIAVTVKEVA